MRTRKLTLIFILISLTLTGCINYEQIATIKTDGSGEMFLHYWMEWKSSSDSLVVNNLEIFNQDSVTSSFTSKYINIEEIQVYRNFRDSTIHTKVEMSFSHIDSLNQLKVFKGANFAIKEAPENTKIFSQFVPPFSPGFGLSKQPVSITYTYYLPGQILQHNADYISNNKLIWKFESDVLWTGKIITATYRPFKLKETPKWIYISAFLVIFVVLVYLFRRKR